LTSQSSTGGQNTVSISSLVDRLSFKRVFQNLLILSKWKL
jgi:hypothetical protein